MLLVFAGITLIACNDAGRKESSDRKDGFSDKPVTKGDSLYQEVMDGHDIGMAKMGKLNKYSIEVQRLLDSLGKLKAPDAALRTRLQSLQKDLHEAQEGMNGWMEGFNTDSASAAETLRIPYLEREKAKVEQVKSNILTSLQRADSLLKKGTE